LFGSLASLTKISSTCLLTVMEEDPFVMTEKTKLYVNNDLTWISPWSFNATDSWGNDQM
jgi:hypothetical protein